MHWRRKWQPTPVFLPGESQDGGAWWAAVYGAAQGQTRLKQLSSSSSCIAGWLFTIWATREAWASWKVAPNWPKGGRSLLGCLLSLGYGWENHRSGSLLPLDRATQDALLMCYSSDSGCSESFATILPPSLCGGTHKGNTKSFPLYLVSLPEFIIMHSKKE